MELIRELTAHSGESRNDMIAKDSGTAAQTRQAETAKAGGAIEAVHLVGSTIVTGGVAVVLTAVAVPVSLGMGMAGGVRALGRKLWGSNK